MKIQYAAFLLPVYPNSSEQEELNCFLRGHRIVQTRKDLVREDTNTHWAVLVEYLENFEKNTSDQIKGKIDYKEILTPEDFNVFSKLRDVRKKLAEEYGLPVYAVCTNDQLAEMAKRRPANQTEFMQISGIGQSKAEKYIPAFSDCLKNRNNENSTALL